MTHNQEYLKDLLRNGNVLDNPDDIYDGGTSSAYTTIKPNGKPAQARVVMFEKKINGTFYVVEAVPNTKAKTLQIVTAFINKKEHY